MSKLSVSETQDHFLRDGKKFFYLADSIWPAFAKISFEEWNEYLDYRSAQGFNVLHMWLQNRSRFGNQPGPFQYDPAGRPDYYRMDDEYFDRARSMLSMATDRGFVPSIAVLWSDKVKDTWLSKQFTPGHVMPLDAVEGYAAYVAKAFDEFDPIYMVGGDTNFESNETSKAYMIALDAIKKISPEALTTIHLWGDSCSLPDEIVHSDKIDYYVYQSGHKRKLQHYAYQFARELYQLPVKRPTVNGEPCFEGLRSLGDWGNLEDYRFTAFDVRKAIWRGLLSGGKAGCGYGAFGVWPWHASDERWEESWQPDEQPWEGEQYFGRPFHWRAALQFPGGWDAAYAKWIFEAYDLFDLEPRNDVLEDTDEIRMAMSSDSRRVVIYIPFAADLRLGMALKDYDWTLVNLSERTAGRTEFKVGSTSSSMKMPQLNSDVLIIGVKR